MTVQGLHGTSGGWRPKSRGFMRRWAKLWQSLHVQEMRHRGHAVDRERARRLVREGASRSHSSSYGRRAQVSTIAENRLDPALAMPAASRS
jgi:hypothetical protein